MDSTNALKKLEKEFNENINSHVFLVETDDEERCLKDIKELLKSTLYNDEVISHQIDEESFIELIIIRPDGKDIKKDQIIELQDRLKVKPVITENMVYIITPFELVNEIASNKLLKTIEEPNPNIIGFLITTNSDLILPTIKSRCEYLKVLYYEKNESNIDSEDTHRIVKDLILAVENIDYNKLYDIKTKKKSLKESARDIENMLKSYYNTACELQKSSTLDNNIIKLIKDKNDKSRLLSKSKYLNTEFNRLTKNMNFELELDKIFFELKEVK